MSSIFHVRRTSGEPPKTTPVSRKRGLTFAFSMALVSTLAMSASPTHAAGETYTYTVKPGDSCFSIAKRLLGKGSKYKLVHKHNPKLGPMPHVLEAGQKLTLPGKNRGADAVVSWLRRDVKARPPRNAQWRKARQNMDLWRLYRVATGSDSAARIAFDADSSRLHLRQNALLVIYGASAKQAARKKTAQKTSIVLEKGIVRGGLDALDKRAGLTIKTAGGATVDLASKDAQIEVDETKAASISVYDGSAKVASKGNAVDVPTDFGTRVEKGKKPNKPRRLPPRVKWAGSGDAIVLVPQGQRGQFEAAWTKTKRAKRYRVELARDSKFKRIIVDAVVGAGIERFRADDLDPGTYYARVAAIDGWRLQGRASKKMKVTVARVESSKTLIPGDKAGEYETAGMLRLAVPEGLRAQMEASTNAGPFGAAEPVRMAKPGRYTIKLRKIGSTVVTQMVINVLPVKGTLEPTTKSAKAGETVNIGLMVADSKDRPSALPGLALWSSLHGDLPITAVERGKYTSKVSIPANAPSGPAELRLRWAGGELTSVSMDIQGKAVAPPTPKFIPKAAGFQWGAGPDNYSQWRRRDANPLAVIAPTTRFGVLSGLARIDGGIGQEDRSVLRLALAGEVSLLDDALAIGLELPFFVADVASDSQGESEFGDPSVSLRAVAFDSDHFKFMPSLVITIPTARRAGTYDGGLTVGFAAMVSPLDWFDIDTTQSIAVWSDFGSMTTVSYGGTYALTFKPGSAIGIGVRFDMRAGLVQPDTLDSYLSLGLGGHLTWRADQFRLGIFVLGGLNEDAQLRQGLVSGGLTLQLGFDGP